MHTTLDLAGWRIRVNCDSAVLAQAFAARFGDFATSDFGSPHLALQVKSGNSEIESMALANYPTAAALRFTDSTGERCTWDAPGCSGRVDLHSNEAALTCAWSLSLADLEYFTRIICALLVTREGGLMMHAAGLGLDGLAHLFIGPSGSGKSTVVALSPAAVPLNDDLVILRAEGDRWMAHATPFWNLMVSRQSGQPFSAPIAGIYSLIQDRKVFLEFPTPAVIVADLVANCPIVNSEVAWLPVLLARCRRLARAVPVQRLHFRKDPDFWELIRRATKVESGE
jgi:hypothetical protein